jgi:proliferating cell nuclear antigen PCNA
MPEEAKDCIVYFSTSQVVQLKTLLDALKELLTEVNLRFDDKGFKIISLDPGKIGMIHASVTNLEKYYCSQKPFFAGIYVAYFYKILRSVNTSHHLECKIRENQPKVMELIVSNGDKRTQTIHRLKLLDLDVEEINIPVVDFEYVISMPSAEFQKYIKELSHVSNLITIRGSGKLIQLICHGGDVHRDQSHAQWVELVAQGQHERNV